MSVAPAVEEARGFSRPQGPYVGLVPYDENDSDFFFGRSQEVAIVSANLRAARLTILYGPSGVGKSSLLMAGVVHGLRVQSHSADEHPFAVCAFRSWLDDPVRGLQEASRAALEEVRGDDLPAAHGTLADSLRAWTERAGTLLLVLDQFEEYFQYHPGEGDDERLTGVAAELAQVINDPTLAVNVLISIREDAWAKLDRFEGHIPLLFANYLRVDHLDVDAAREAIEGPIAAWNATLEPGAEPYDVEPSLIAAVLDAAAGGRVALAAAGEAAATGEAATGDRVEAPFLQLVLDRLWRATVADGAHALTLARLEALGGARRIVETHLLDALGRLTGPEQDAASDCFRFLVSSSNAKIAHAAADLAEWTRRRETQVAAVLDKLCTGESGRILRAVAPGLDQTQSTSYELFHDVLAEPILAWRRRHEQERNRRAARRRLARVGSVSLTLIAVFAALGIWALIERRHANELAEKQTVLLHAQQAENARLIARAAELKKSSKKVKKDSDIQKADVKTLTKTNSSLTALNRQLRETRAGLGRRIATLRAENRRLVAGVARFNTKNRALAAKSNALDTEYDRLAIRLGRLQSVHESLASDAGTLKAEAAALQAQRKSLYAENVVLARKAAELGRLPLAQQRPAFTDGPPQTPHHKPKVAADVAIPLDVPGSDVLRRRVENLEQQLTQLLEQRARLRDEARLLRSENELLAQQRDALRSEIADLEQTRAALDARRVQLREKLAQAEAENQRLRSAVAVRETRNGRRRDAVDAERRRNAKLQGANNRTVGSIGYTQFDISYLRQRNQELVAEIAPPVDRLVQAAQYTSQESALAGLLAVKAYRLTPFDADDPAHPGVYNALWSALSRLDENAARSLIAPVASPRSKLGTTQSATLVHAICGLVTRGFTRDEWKRFLPSAAPYNDKSSRPCS